MARRRYSGHALTYLPPTYVEGCFVVDRLGFVIDEFQSNEYILVGNKPMHAAEAVSRALNRLAMEADDGE